MTDAPDHPAQPAGPHAKPGGWRKKFGKWLSANVVVTTALVWITAFMFRSRLYELVGNAFWFPPEWRKMSIFLLVVIGTTTYAIGHKRQKIRRLMDKADGVEDPAREARRSMRWATGFGIAFLMLTCVYALLWYRCVIQFDHELDPEDDVKPAAAAHGHGDAESDEAGEDAWPRSKYVYVPLFRPDKPIGDYKPELDNWHEAFSNDYQGVHDKLYAEHAFALGVTTVIFLNVYAAMVVALAGAFVNTFSAKEFLGEATVEKVKSTIS